jgi:ApeA N-terminal domain 1
MKSFKVNGQWSIDENEKKQMAGTLTYSKKGLRLKLLGSFRSGWSPTAGSNYPVIKGVVEKNPFGSFVTLYNCYTSSTSINHVGVGTESIGANRAILGDDHPPNGPQTYEGLSLRFTHLDEWVGWKNFEVEWRSKGEIGINVQYTKPENLSFQIDDITLKIGTSFGSSEDRGRAVIKEKTHLVIGPITDTPADRASDKYLYRLQNMLTFATDTPNANDENLIYGEKVAYGNALLHKQFHLFTAPGIRYKVGTKKLFERDMLFTFDDTQKAGLNIFQKWFDLIKHHEHFTVFYFAHIYRPHYYMDDKFRSIMTEFCIYCISAFQPSDRATETMAAVNSIIGATYDAQEMPLLGRAIPVGAELDMPFHMAPLSRIERMLNLN